MKYGCTRAAGKKGQFSILAALLMMTILVCGIIATYSAIRNTIVQDSQQTAYAIEELKSSINKLLDFTVGYYGSILQVTANITYAKNLTQNYFYNSFDSIARSYPKLNPSFKVNSLNVSSLWFEPSSYSSGRAQVAFSLGSLGIYGVQFDASSILKIDVQKSPNPNEARVVITRNGRPELTLKHENFFFYSYSYSDSSWNLVHPEGEVVAFVNGTYVLQIPEGVDSGFYMLQIVDQRGITISASYVSKYVYTLTWNTTLYSSLAQDTIVVEALQNGTLRWLGQNLQLLTQGRPIPPLPVKMIHINQTINGVDREVPFQIEDWNSEYRVAVGLTGNASIFSNRNMIVFLVNHNVSKVTLWWDGRDIANQTSFSWKNIYFYDDNPDEGILTNGELTLNFKGRKEYLYVDSFDGTYSDWLKVGTSPYINNDFSNYIEGISSESEWVSYYPSGYNLIGSTSYVSGNINDLQSNNNVYMTFRSYHSITSMSDFVDQICDLYSPSAKGTHSNFTAQQYGPDSVYDMLTEVNTGIGNVTLISGESFEGTWPPIGWTETGYWSKSSSQAYQGTYSARFDSPSGGSSGDLTTLNLDCLGVAAIYVDFWYRDSSCESNELLLQYYDGASWDTIYDLGATTSEGQWLHYQQKITDSQYFKSNFKIRWDADTSYYNDDFYVDLVTIKKEVDNTNYELDLEVQWTSADFDEVNEELCIYCGTMGSENLLVDVWSGGAWQNLFANLVSEWNNISITSYLTSSTFTIRYRGGVEVGDTSRTTWDIDVALLHTWSDKNIQAVEVEFTGSSNIEDWTQLIWTVDSALTIGSVNVTLQLYNYALDNYPISGNGYMKYTSSPTANTDETKNQTITVNPEDFRDVSGNWKVKIKAEKIGEQFDLKVDCIEFKTMSTFELPKQGWFGFQNSLGSGTIESVMIQFETKCADEDYFVFWVNDGTTTYGPYTISNLPNDYDWKEYGLSSLLNTWTKINNAKIYVEYRKNGGSATSVWIRRCRLFVEEPDESGFTVISTVGTSTAEAEFMRINGEEPQYGAGLAYVIHHGIVRDIVQQEPEWSGGANNCPNVYGQIVLTLPANATYYTYALRAIFIDSLQTRTMTDFSALQLSAMGGQPRTENGISGGMPVVSSSEGLFYNLSSWAHHWSEFINSNSGSGIMFATDANYKLYTFDSISGQKVGALKISNSAKTIEFNPVGRLQFSFTTSLDVTWYGAVVTFDGEPIYPDLGGNIGLWIIVEYPPIIAVS